MFRGCLSFFGAGMFAATGSALRASTRAVARCDDHFDPEVHEQCNAQFIAAEEKKPAVANATSYPWQKQTNGLTTRYQPFKIVGSVEIAPETKLIRFALKDGATYNCPPCSTLQFRLQVGSASNMIERFYTPCTTDGTKGHFDIIVREMPNGRMSQALNKLQPGTTVDVRMQQFKMKYWPNKYECVGLLCGGTGMTPALQIIRQALPLADSDTYTKHACRGDFSLLGNTADEIDPAGLAALKKQQALDQTKISLLFCNRNEDHVMLKSYFDELAERFPSRFRVNYLVDKAKDPAKWTARRGHHIGFVSKELITATMPPPKATTEQDPRKNIVLVAGPDGLMSHVCGNTKLLSAMHGGNSRHSSRKTQGLGDLANMQLVGGLLAEAGYDGESVYRF